MALFGFGKKKEEKQVPTCCCGNAEEKTEETACCSAPKAEETAVCCDEPVNGICCVKVLGAGCKSCHEQYENAKAAVKALGLDLEVEYITDMEKVMGYPVEQLPGTSGGGAADPGESRKGLQAAENRKAGDEGPAGR